MKLTSKLVDLSIGLLGPNMSTNILAWTRHYGKTEMELLIVPRVE